MFHGRTELLDDRVDQTGFFAIVQPEVGNGRIVQTGIRQGFLALLTETESGQPIRLVGTHLDDRSEQLRLEQALQLPKADVVMGDLNAMHGEDPVAKALRLLQPLTDRLTDRFDISPELATRPHDRIATLAKRLARMGHGTTLRVLQESFDLYDADITHEPTIRGIAQLDHILTKPHITTSDYTVHHDVKLSDHKPISATIDR